MGMVEVLIDRSDVVWFIEDMLALAPDLKDKLLDDEADIFADYITGHSPVKTGNNAASTTVDVEGDTRVIYSDNDPITTFIILGTRAHPISPVVAQALYWGGALHPVPYSPKKGYAVWHPGTIANDYIALAFMDAIYDAEDRADQFLDDLVGD